MADTQMQEAILHGDLIIRVNAALSPYDPHKFTGALLTDLTAALSDARQKNSASLGAAGDQAGARLRVPEARRKLAGLVRNSQSHINALPDDDVSAADKVDALVTLGFEGGQLGDLDEPLHLRALVDSIIRENPNLAIAVRVPATIVSRLTNWAGILDANQTIADGGNRQEITDDKDAAREVLEKRNARVRLYLASCTDEGESDPGLAKFGFQPKRAPGDAQPQPLPGPPAPATLDAPNRTLTIPSMPANATSIVGWRQPAGADPEPAGISDGLIVGIADVSPLVVGVSYTVWVTGRNSRGDGPAGNKITFTA